MTDAKRRPTRARHVIEVAPTPFFADRGCHVRILEEARVLQERGYRVTICTYGLGDDVPGVTVRRSVRIPWYRKLSAGPSLHKFYLDALLAWTLLRTCFRDRPDVIHAHLHEGVLIGWLAARLLRVPLVADLQGSLTAEMVEHGFLALGRWPHRFFRMLERAILRLPSAFLLSSLQAVEGFAQRPEDLGVPARILTDCVDVDAFRPASDRDALRRKLGLAEKARLVGYIGVLSEYQGVSVLLEAARLVLDEVPDARFLVMGYPNVEAYRRKAADLGIADRVSIPGRVPYVLAPDYLAACEVGVSAKRPVSEANGKLLNYMAVGIPIVATDTPVNRGLLGDRGVYAGVDDPVSLAQGLINVLKDDSLAGDLGRRLRRQAVERHSWEAGADQMRELYRALGR